MLLDGLTAEERAKIERIGHGRIFRAGECVVIEGESAHAVYLVLRGRLDVQKPLGEGRVKTLAQLKPLDCFGEMAFLDQEPRSANVMAVTDGELLAIPMAAFADLMERDPAIGMKIYRELARILAGRLRTLDEDMRSTLRWAIEGWTFGG
jgi:CRP-like cAMP-binding protein